MRSVQHSPPESKQHSFFFLISSLRAYFIDCGDTCACTTLSLLAAVLHTTIHIVLGERYTTILFIAREPFRKACLSVRPPPPPLLPSSSNHFAIQNSSILLVLSALCTTTSVQTMLSSIGSARFISFNFHDTCMLILMTPPPSMLGNATRQVPKEDINNASWPLLANLVWMCVPAGACLATVLGYVWSTQLEMPDDPHYAEAVAVYAASAVIELFVEPLWILGQIFEWIRLKVVAEGAALAARCAVTIALLFLQPQLGLRIFSIAQLAHSGVLLAVYFWTFASRLKKDKELPLKSVRDIFPRMYVGVEEADGAGAASNASQGPRAMFQTWKGLGTLCWSFMKQSLMKQFLTKGEGYIMTFFNVMSFSEQGVYNVVDNLGSLLARFLFQPIEETFYTFFAGLLGRASSRDPNGDDEDDEEDEEITFKVDTDKKRQNRALATKTLQTLFKFVVLVGLTVAAFAQGYSELALNIYGGDVVSTEPGPTLLRSYAVYIIFLAVNGVTECFMFAAMSAKQVADYNWWLMAFSAVFFAAAWGCTYMLGSVGFIVANCINMFVRIVQSYMFIGKYGKEDEEEDEEEEEAAGEERTAKANAAKVHPLQAALPSTAMFGAFAASFAVTMFSKSQLCCGEGFGWNHKLLHMAVAVAMLGVCGAALWLTDRPFLVDLRNLFSGRKKAE